jgi:putative oxidoreductase
MHFEKTVQGIADHGIPLPRLVMPSVLLMEFGGAALLLADQYSWAVCLVWIAFLLLATYFYHRRFVTPEGGVDFFEYVQFWKNVSMIGGLIALILLDPSRP